MLQSQLDGTHRRASTLQTVVDNMTKERDSAVSQLGVAYFTIEELKNENRDLATDNQQLRAQIKQLNANHDNETLQWTTKEEDLRRTIQQAKDSVRNLEEMSKNFFSGRRRSPDATADRVNRSTTNLPVSHVVDMQPSIRYSNHSKDTDKTQARITETGKSVTPRERDTFSGSRMNRNIKDLLRGIAPAEADDTHNSQDSDAFMDIAREEAELSQRSAPRPEVSSSRTAKNVQMDDSSQDLTYLSFLKVCCLCSVELVDTNGASL